MQHFTKHIAVLIFLLLSLPANACFGPKLYVGTASGQEGELLYHLVAIYLKEKTGVESVRVEMVDEQTAEILLEQEKIDFGYSFSASDKWPHMLSLADQLFLLHGPRPVEDLQFTTVPKTLVRLQAKLQADDVKELRRQVAAGVLPAKAVRTLFMQRGWL